MPQHRQATMRMCEYFRVRFALLLCHEPQQERSKNIRLTNETRGPKFMTESRQGLSLVFLHFLLILVLRNNRGRKCNSRMSERRMRNCGAVFKCQRSNEAKY